MIKHKINIKDFLTFITWVQTYCLFEGKKFKYNNLLMQAETYSFNDTPLDTNIHRIDDLMIDAFQIYHKLKETEDKISEVLDDMPEMKNIPIKKEEMIAETKKYEYIFEDLIENYKFDDPEVKGIQKGILTEKMAEYVQTEEYEKAAKVRDMIKMC